MARSADGTALQCVLNTVGVLMWDVTSEGQPSDTGGDASGDTRTLKEIFGGTCDPNGPTTYSTGIGDPNSWAYIEPLGAMTFIHVTPVDHFYFYYPTETAAGAKPSYSLTSPADGIIVEVEDFRKVNNWPYPDFRVVIAHSCDLYSIFIHVGALVGAAAEAAAGAAESGKWYGAIPVKAGEVIADRSEAPKFDFTTLWTNATNTILNPASYRQKEAWKPYTANPFDFLPDDVRRTYEAKVLRTAAPTGGTIFYDISGTAQGVWFEKDSNGYFGLADGDEPVYTSESGFALRGYWDTHLAFAPHHVDPSTFIYSIGNFDGCPCQFVTKNNVDPSTITASGAPTVIDLVKYDLVKPDGTPMDERNPVKGYKLKPKSEVIGSIALQVNADGTMTVEKRPGKDAASFKGFGSEAKTYTR